MDIRSKNGWIRQTKNINAEKKHPNMNSGSIKVSPRQVVITTPKPRSSIADRGHTPSSIPRIKSVPLFIPTRRSSINTKEFPHKTFKDCGKKNLGKTSYLNSENISNSEISQSISKVNKTSTKFTRATSTFNRNNKHIQACSTLNPSTRSPRLNTKKTRKPINLNLFRSSSQQNTPIMNSSINIKNNSATLPCKDHSEFSDWEFIDWPWVTPYKPLAQIPPSFDIKNLNFFLKSGPKPSIPYFTWGSNISLKIIESIFNKDEKPTAESKKYHRLQDSEKSSEQLTPLNTEPFWNDYSLKTKHKTCQNKTPSLHAVLPMSDSTPRNTMWDPAVILHGPIHCSHDENYIERYKQKQSTSTNVHNGELCSKTLQRCAEEIINCLAKMTKKDGALLQEALQAFLDSKKNDELRHDFRNDSDKETSIGGHQALNRHLNPDVPDFRPKKNNTSDSFTEVERFPLLQTTNLNRMFAKEMISRNRYKESIGVSSSQVKPQISLAKEKTNRDENKTFRKNYRERVSSSRSNDIDNKLMETCLKKIQLLEAEARQNLIKGEGLLNNTPFTQKNSSFSTGSVSEVLYDIKIDDDNVPGRVANAMEPSWATQMLEKFRSKYPMTGTVKSSPVIDMKKKLFCDQQQRLEYLLLQRKENNIYQQQMYRMTSSEASSWDKYYSL